MSLINISGNTLNIDIIREVEQFDWVKPRWSSEKLIAASPFRYDRTPSFFVNLETGGWKDSGAYDEDYESGNLAKLLAFLRDETYEETVDYLTEVYGIDNERNSQENLSVTIPSFRIKPDEKRIELDEGTMEPYQFRHPYLARRGITEQVQRFMGVGYDRGSRAVVLPWRHADGSLANIKYRKVQGKTFWYAKDAAPVRFLVYGIDKVYKYEYKEVVVCEAEIDALSWYVLGWPAVALGGTTVTEKQLNLLRKSPIERLIIAGDNDKPGGKLKQSLAKGMQGYVDLKQIKIPGEYKDANEFLVGRGIGVGFQLVVTDFNDFLNRHIQK